MSSAEYVREIHASLNKHCVDVLVGDLAKKAELVDALTAERDALKAELSALKEAQAKADAATVAASS
jgi:cell division protein FtsB